MEVKFATTHAAENSFHFSMWIALTRPVSESIAKCELTHLSRAPIDVARAVAQHAAYEDSLRACGCRVQQLPEAPSLPDAVFVEDTCAVLDELAIITRPGAESRRAETPAIAEALQGYRPLREIQPPGTVDGGDVLLVGRKLYVGRSTRTNAHGIEQLRALAMPHGYELIGVVMNKCLHLKSAATAIGENRLLVNPAWVEPAIFGELECIAVDPTEPHAATALLIGNKVIYPTHHPKTAERLRAAGIDLCCVDVSELAKAEAGVTCCSVVFEQN